MRVFLSVVLLCLSVAFLVNRALAPLYGRFDAVECQAAYSAAHTMRDTMRVDLHPAVPFGGGRQKGYCSQHRAGRAATVADLSAPATR